MVEYAGLLVAASKHNVQTGAPPPFDRIAAFPLRAVAVQHPASLASLASISCIHLHMEATQNPTSSSETGDKVYKYFIALVFL